MREAICLPHLCVNQPFHFVGAIHESPGERGSPPMGGGRIVMRPYKKGCRNLAHTPLSW